MRLVIEGIMFAIGFYLIVLSFLHVSDRRTPYVNPTHPLVATGYQIPTKALVYSKEYPVLQLMDQCIPAKSALSPGRRLILARQVARIGEEFLGSASGTPPQALEFFPLIPCIESSYQPGAKSPVGAVGIAQVMPQFAAEFTKECGIGKVSQDDVLDTEVNLTASACRFRYLIRHFKGSVPLALAAYNAGRDSSTLKKLQAGSASNPETDGYLAKFWVLHTQQGVN